ncbi:hypothetical protein VL20_4614 [Microcystis panniformis FACHB-1757]|uniref:Uncharacterized protein n=1 Tax=Microcystis panniformis FACHB-1757 TaxID=1638788 RepID=A0A0K1S633_9CHRO|nr:hypothetical protein VL20_4614 [Microcystis panniformis FACHB-1757]
MPSLFLMEILRQHFLGIADVKSGSRIGSSLAVIPWLPPSN